MYDSIFDCDLFFNLIVPAGFFLGLYVIYTTFFYYLCKWEYIDYLYNRYVKYWVVGSIAFVVLEITIVCNYFLK